MNFEYSFKRFLIKYARILNLSSFEKLWAKSKSNSIFPKQLNLSLSLLCPSQCIYCAPRGTKIVPKIMPEGLFLKILQEAQEHHFTGSFSLGENGEALTHPQFKQLFKILRRQFPKNEIILFSNMVLMDDENARFLLEQGLNYLHFNFDGASPQTYDYIKRNGRFEQVKQNILNFFRIRDELIVCCRIGIGYVTAARFSKEIEGKEGLMQDDEAEILNLLKPLLRRDDFIQADLIGLEKYQRILNRQKREPCDLFKSVLTEMFIAPSGQVYICCADFGVTSNLGNVNHKTIRYIWNSESRKAILKDLFKVRVNSKKTFEVCKTCLPCWFSSWSPDLYVKCKKKVQMEFVKGRLAFVNGTLRIRDKREDSCNMRSAMNE
jgi:radical SAM protein with 4Fe4S-binding SPASM domain